MSFSYVGLAMATGLHISKYGPPGWSFCSRALLYWGLPLAVGIALIYGKRDTVLSPFQTDTSAAESA